MMLSILFNGLWEGALIVGLAYLCLTLIPAKDATTRYALWFVTLIALVFVPVFSTLSNAGSLIIAALQPHSPGTTRFTVSLIPVNVFAGSTGSWLQTVTPWIIGVWIVGVTFSVARLGASLYQIHRIRRSSVAVPMLGSSVRASSNLAVPIAAGVFSPLIIIPAHLVETLSTEDLLRIVDHERAHISRNDIAGNLVQRAIEALLFFNPWVHLVGRKLVQEREAACDDWVVKKNGAADEYAACLAALAQTINRVRVPYMTPSAFGSRRAVVMRIERLITGASGALKINYYTLGGTIMLFAVLTLALQAVSPAFAPVMVSSSNPAVIAAAACKNPNAPVNVTNAVAPNIPHGLQASGTVNVLVSIGADGHVQNATVKKSSGNVQIDRAVLDAAKASSYSAQTVNCRPEAGTYVFQAEFRPK